MPAIDDVARTRAAFILLDALAAALSRLVAGFTSPSRASSLSSAAGDRRPP